MSPRIGLVPSLYDCFPGGLEALVRLRPDSLELLLSCIFLIHDGFRLGDLLLDLAQKAKVILGLCVAVTITNRLEHLVAAAVLGTQAANGQACEMDGRTAGTLHESGL